MLAAQDVAVRCKELGIGALHIKIRGTGGQRSKTAGPGGQSALRYSRLRDEADLAFLRRVAERAKGLLEDARGIILAGKADAKHRLVRELPQPLNGSVICVLDLPCSASVDALRMAALRAAGAVGSDRCRESDEALSRFMELVELPSTEAQVLVCYGGAQTATALAMGAVETMLIASEEDAEHWRSIANLHGTSTVEVQASSEQGVKFAKSFRVGGCLRWPMDPDLLEDQAEEPKQDDASTSAGESEAPAASLPEDEAAGHRNASPAGDPNAATQVRPTLLMQVHDDVPCHHSDAEGLFPWLTQALQDQASAEALVACVEVILGDEGAHEEEVLAQAMEMLIGEGVPQNVVDEFTHRAQ